MSRCKSPGVTTVAAPRAGTDPNKSAIDLLRACAYGRDAGVGVVGYMRVSPRVSVRAKLGGGTIPYGRDSRVAPGVPGVN